MSKHSMSMSKDLMSKLDVVDVETLDVETDLHNTCNTLSTLGNTQREYGDISALQCVVMFCSVLQHPFNFGQHAKGIWRHQFQFGVAVCCSVLQCVAVCCGVLQCVAVCCSVLQCASVLQCTVADIKIKLAHNETPSKKSHGVADGRIRAAACRFAQINQNGLYRYIYVYIYTHVYICIYMCIYTYTYIFNRHVCAAVCTSVLFPQ